MNKEKSEIFDFDLIQSILLNLPNRFQAFISIYRSAPPKDQEFSDFAEQVILEDRQMSRPQQHPESTANGIQMQEKWQKKGKGNKKGKSKIDKSKLDSNSPIIPPFNSINQIKSKPYLLSHKIKFLLDTGASCNFVNDRTLFINFTENKSKILLADNTESESEGYGTILWKTTDKNRKQITIKLNKVRFVPNLKTNLLSLSALFQQYPKASEIYRNNKNIIIKIRQNEIEFKLKDKTIC